MSEVTDPARNRDLPQQRPPQGQPGSHDTTAVNLDKQSPAPADRAVRAAQQRAASEQRRRQQKQVREERKRPLPDKSAMVRQKNRVAMVTGEAGGYLTLQTAEGLTRYRVADARSGRLISGRLFLTNPDGTTTKARAYLPGERAPSEIGATHKSSSDGGISGLFASLGDDPISAVIALVVLVLMLLALPIVLYVWIRNRRRRSNVVRRVLDSAATAQESGLGQRA